MNARKNHARSALKVSLSLAVPALLLLAALSPVRGEARTEPLKVVTTLPDYAVVARAIGGDRVTVRHIVLGDQDAHFIRPKPSFVSMVRDADVLVTTGLDLEMWLPTLLDTAGNARVRSGQLGFVAVSRGVHLLEKPRQMSRIEGGLHIYGNPHITTSPVNIRVIARNIALGLIKNDPAGKELYEKNLRAFQGELDRRTYGEDLVKWLGGKTLSKLAEKQRLIPFLKGHKFRGKPLIDSLGGWLKKMMPLRDRPVVTYHKNWVYFLDLYGMKEFTTIEPKPGIPPSPKHVQEVIERTRDAGVKIILAASYFDENRIQAVAKATGATAVIVPPFVGGGKGAEDYFQLMDLWTDSLLAAAGK